MFGQRTNNLKKVVLHLDFLIGSVHRSVYQLTINCVKTFFYYINQILNKIQSQDLINIKKGRHTLPGVYTHSMETIYLSLVHTGS